jgi:hypothetical protein
MEHIPSALKAFRETTGVTDGTSTTQISFRGKKSLFEAALLATSSICLMVRPEFAVILILYNIILYFVNKLKLPSFYCNISI